MQLLTDLKNGVVIGQSLAPVAATATGNGTGVDLLNGDVRTHCIIDNGAVTGAAIWTVQMEYSDDNSAWTAEPGADALSGQISAAGITILSYTRHGRYARAVRTLVSGTSSIIGMSILAMKKDAPASYGYDRSPST